MSGSSSGVVVGEGLVLMGAGALVGVLGAALLLRAMRTLLFGVTPQDVTTYVGVIGVLFAVALLASYIPARRVARVEPLTALRQD